MELLAQVIEELSILTTKKYTRSKPRKIDRPKWVGGGDAPEAERASSNPFARAIDAMMGFSPQHRSDGEYTGVPPEHLKAAMS